MAAAPLMNSVSPTGRISSGPAARYIARPLEEEGVATLLRALVLADPTDARAASRRLADAARPADVLAPS